MIHVVILILVEKVLIVNEMVLHLKETFPDVLFKQIEPASLIFEERVKLNCIHCERYNKNWKCPPRIPDLDYEKAISEYRFACFAYKEYLISGNNYAEIREKSALYLHKTLLRAEELLFKKSNALSITFIGGSCRQCKNGCGQERCANPSKARIPIEAIGINVVESAAINGIRIHFPIENILTRIGLILW
jgi:predicted metal-binding protein